MSIRKFTGATKDEQNSQKTPQRAKQETHSHPTQCGRFVAGYCGNLHFFQNNAIGGGTPKLVVDQEKIDFGDVKNFTEKSFTITVTNTGDGVLRFKETPYIEVVEGCCPPKLTIATMTLKPGESTTITSAEFSMHPGMDGKHNFAVHLNTNDPTQADLVVNVLSNWLQ